MLRYETHVKNNSLYNTPPCYSIYMVGLVLKWLLARGGVEAMQKINENKAALLYDFLDQSTFFTGTVAKEDRSLMNVPFVFDPGINLLAFTVSALTGVVFGFFPARRAAKLDPIEAVRHE